jgi:hypothetical protein
VDRGAATQHRRADERERPTADITRSRKEALNPTEADVRIRKRGRCNIHQQYGNESLAQVTTAHEFDQRIEQRADNWRVLRERRAPPSPRQC